MKRQFIKTADGSTSIYLEGMDDYYHSKYGAIAESNHIFIKNGLLSRDLTKEINVLEVGMGTGLNVLTTMKASNEYGLKIHYDAIEAYPIKMEELSSINFAEILKIEDSLLRNIHDSPWETKVQLQPHFNLTKYQAKLQDAKLELNQCDVVYFDAFSPDKQEEMWSEGIFKKLYHSLKPGGVLVTYCVKGMIRRLLQSVGFKVEKLKGPEGGKREMCRAIKPLT